LRWLEVEEARGWKVEAIQSRVNGHQLLQPAGNNADWAFDFEADRLSIDGRLQLDPRRVDGFSIRGHAEHDGHPGGLTRAATDAQPVQESAERLLRHPVEAAGHL